MDAHQVEVRSGDGLTNGAGRVSGLDGEPELGVQDASGGEGVGVGINVGRQADHHVLDDALVSGDLVQHAQLVEAVDHNAPNARFHGELQLLWRLVVAVEIDVLHRHSRSDGDGQLPAGYHVHPQSLLGHQLGYGGVEERLGCVGNQGVGVSRREAVHELAAHTAQGVLIVHEERSAELGGQARGVTAADGQVVSGVDSGGHGEEVDVVEGQ